MTSRLALGVLLMVLASCTSASDTSRTDVAAQPETAATATVLPSPSPAPLATAVLPVDPPATITPTPGTTPTTIPTLPDSLAVQTGAHKLVEDEFALLRGLRVGLITHRPSQVDGQRLADLLDAAPDVDLVALFAPEHGLDGTVAAGSAVSDTYDQATNTPIFSLYGLDRSPDDDSIAAVDILVYDLQDVGTRFFTYTSTLGLSMQAASRASIPFVVLDRPNPLGSDLQGPLLTPGSESFIGLYPIPSAYGLTSGELALLIQRQSWLDDLEDLDLTVVKVANWKRDQVWFDTGLPWIAPSPNLPTASSALLYPGTVLFEATTISEGRGTDEPFLTIAAPWIDGAALATQMRGRQLPGVAFDAIQVSPRSIPLAAPNPRYLGEEIFGVQIRVTDATGVSGLEVGLHLLDAILRQGEQQGISAEQIIDRPEVFDRLAGTSRIRTDLIAGRTVDQILSSFRGDHASFADLAAAVSLYD